MTSPDTGLSFRSGRPAPKAISSTICAAWRAPSRSILISRIRVRMAARSAGSSMTSSASRRR
jgi:hypothetical protein